MNTFTIKISPFRGNFPRFAVSLIAALGVQGGAMAADANVRTIENTQRITNMLHSVPTEQIMVIVEKIENGQIQRRAPEQPIWIIDSASGSLLYYQGQPSFKGQSAGQLVDDAGQRFGIKALEYGQTSKSGWMTVKLGEQRYRAYCHSKAPTVVCSMIP